MVSGHLHQPVQPATQALRTPVQRTLQVAHRGQQQQRVFADGVRTIGAGVGGAARGGTGSGLQADAPGLFFGDKTLKEELLAAVNAQAGPWHYGEELREWAEAKAERIVAEELKRRKWDATVLGARRKGDPGKLAIARRLREETTMTLAWIAERLKMGTKTHLASALLGASERMKPHDTIDRPL